MGLIDRIDQLRAKASERLAALQQVRQANRTEPERDPTKPIGRPPSKPGKRPSAVSGKFPDHPSKNGPTGSINPGNSGKPGRPPR
ncbi:MAG TPA: hypothetical protein VHU91_04185 [Mycobacteriales bacterium]|jgi:hypothetical protein|nr:hypothetical protein [Mycobacteriales bacterium]